MEDKEETNYSLVDCSNYLVEDPKTNTGVYLIPKDIIEHAYSVRIGKYLWARIDTAQHTTRPFEE